MGRFLKILLLFTIIFIHSGKCFSDSPLTSTVFHEAYIDIDEILTAEQTNEMTKELAEYLHSKMNTIDLKAALINALGWENVTAGNAEKYCRFIFNKTPDKLDLQDLGSEDLFVMGYLTAMENYHHPSVSLKYLKKARKDLKMSFTVNVIYSLVQAQIAMEKDFCKAWKYYVKVYNNKNLNQDMRQSALKIIYDYMYLYKSYCK